MRKILMWWTGPTVSVKITFLRFLDYIPNKLIYLMFKLTLVIVNENFKIFTRNVMFNQHNLCSIGKINWTYFSTNWWQTSNSSTTTLDIFLKLKVKSKINHFNQHRFFFSYNKKITKILSFLTKFFNSLRHWIVFSKVHASSSTHSSPPMRAFANRLAKRNCVITILCAISSFWLCVMVEMSFFWKQRPHQGQLLISGGGTALSTSSFLSFEAAIFLLNLLSC